VAAGNAHLSAIVICGGLIEHECRVLLRKKQVARIERSEIELALRGWSIVATSRRTRRRDVGHDRESSGECRCRSDLAFNPTSCYMLLAKKRCYFHQL
jgi:hypothetical protein